MNPRRPPRRLLLGLVLVAFGALAGCRPDAGEPPAAADRPLAVTVSIAPFADLVERLAGERVEIQVLLPHGASPELWAPSPHQVLALERARLVVAVGHPHFAFEARHLRPHLAGRDDVEIVELAGPEQVMPAGTFEAGESDPHLWLSPFEMAQAVARLTPVLQRLLPEESDAIQERSKALLQEFVLLQQELSNYLIPVADRSFWVHHPAWGHFAHGFRLVQKAIESEGKAPSPERLLAVIEEMRREGVRTLFVQPGISARTAHAVAREIGAEVVTLDPLARDYFANLRHAAIEIRAAIEAQDAAARD